MRLVSRLAAITAVVLSPVVVAVTPAQAAEAANGARCTVTGTAGNDHLYGTSHSDVICGLGGNDVIYARGGNDVVDAGSGADTIVGGDGSDTVYAGTGNDSVATGDGADTIYGGPGSDSVAAGAGNDHVYAGDGADTVTGGYGADSLSGGSGSDSESGGPGDDRVSGGLGGDTETGGTGTDVVAGNDGNDDLSGGSGADAIYGGDGTNWCTLDAADTVHRHCVYDTEPPKVVDMTLSSSSVDVSAGSADVVVRVHVTDDTGVVSVQANTPADQVSGSVRDGWWESTITVPRWAEPGTIDLQVDMRDRTGRWGSASYPDAITVTDSNPDSDRPTLTQVAMSPTSVDVRTAAKTINVSATFTDAVSGVADFPYACLNSPSVDSPDGFSNGPCGQFALTSGTRRNGVWTTSIVVPKGAISGTWELNIHDTDRAHPNDDTWWTGPSEYAFWQNGVNSGGIRQIPGDAQVYVTGSSDESPPSLVHVEVTPDQVDTLPAGQWISIDIHATDADVDGIKDVGLAITSATASSNDPSWFPGSIEEPASGTKHDGVWHFDVYFEQGTAPATYYLDVYIDDATHSRHYVDQNSPYVGQQWATVMTPDQGDSTVTVIQHQA